MYSWVVVRTDMFDSVEAVEGPFLTEGAATTYALRSLWLGNEPLSEGSKISPRNFTAVPWFVKDPKGFWSE